MTLGIEAKSLLERLNSFRSKAPGCTKIFCTTCGGRGAEVLKRRLELYDEVGSVLSRISLDEFVEFGDWVELLERINYVAVVSVYSRAAQMIDVSDVRELDRFLLRASKYNGSATELDALYKTHLETGIRTAIETEDNSLVETLVLVMGEDILNNGELLSLALAKRSDPNVARALYNRLRQVLPEVRDYPFEK